MNSDITFCGNAALCDRKETCRRAHPPTDCGRLSFADIYSEGECKAYWPILLKEEEK